MGELEFVHPSVLFLLLLVPAAGVFLLWRERSRRARLNRIGDAALVELLSRRVSYTRRLMKSIFWVLAFTALIVAVARPAWGVRVDRIETQGVSVFVLLDVSESMNAEDVPPSRLTRAKIGLLDIAQGIEGNEMGLVAFAGSAFVVFPLTTDVNAVQTFLNNVSTNSMSRQGTAIDAAVRLALQSFDELQATERVMLLVTDGENQTEGLDSALQDAISEDVPIHVLAYGTEAGGSIPIRNSEGLVVGNKRNREGEVVITSLNEPLLRQIANRTGGSYHRVDTSDAPVQEVIATINALEGGALGEDDTVRGVERFALFAGLALLLLSIEMLLPENRP
jgi:Ca-activated chloride channel family protein